jgi:hypothetical protein
MENWFTINLGDALIAEQYLEQIKKLFYSKYRDADEPEEMAVFLRHESEGRIHCEACVYFSPAAASLAKAMEAVPCNKPANEGLSLLAGSESAWRILFAESDIDKLKC